MLLFQILSKGTSCIQKLKIASARVRYGDFICMVVVLFVIIRCSSFFASAAFSPVYVIKAGWNPIGDLYCV